MQQLFNLWYFIATGFGLGSICNKVPVGTIASLVSIPVWWILMCFLSYKEYFIFLMLGIMIGIYCCGKTNSIMNVHDHKSIVWDEFVGMWITLIAVPQYSWLWISVAFVLFRILDIVKPWPISWVDRVVTGGIGIVIDDVLAGIMSMCIILYLRCDILLIKNIRIFLNIFV